MYKVLVYEDDRQTFAGDAEFHSFKAAEYFAKLNQPCEIWQCSLCTQAVKVAEFGFEEEE